MVVIFSQIILLFISLSVYANITVSANKTALSSVETFVLNINLENNLKATQLDLSVLEKDFDILNQSNQQSFFSINGKQSSQERLQIELAAKRTGKLIIPSFKIAKYQSKPMTITVSDIGQSANKPSLFITSEVDKKQVLVQAQLIYQINLYSKQRVQTTANMFKPRLNHVFIEMLKSSATKRVQYQGAPYFLQQLRYALFPQKRGALRIPAINIAAQYGGQNIRLRANSLNIEVLPQPANINLKPWLPAQSVRLSARYLKEPAVFKVGEPINREITLSITGIAPEQLIDIPLKDSDVFAQYPDKSDISKTVTSESITSIKKQNIVIIPNQAGEQLLPAITIDWYNSKTKTVETATLAAQKIKVIKALANHQKTQNSENNVITPPQNISPTLKVKTISPKQTSNTLWQISSALLMFFWLTTVWFFYRYYKKTKKQKTKQLAKKTVIDDSATLRKKIKQACLKNEGYLCRKHLINWSRQALNQDISGLTALANIAPFNEIKTALLTLDSVLYTNNKTNWQGMVFWQQIKPLLRIKATTNNKKNNSKLPPLYPPL